MSNFEKVREFHEKFGAPVRNEARDISDEELMLRVKLITEEYDELLNELKWLSPNKLSVARAAKEMADLLYVVYGTALVMGINLDDVFAEVHESNMSKTPGNLRSDGKILKGPDYKAPDIENILNYHVLMV